MKKIAFFLILIIIVVKAYSQDEQKLIIDPQGHSGQIGKLIFSADGKNLISVADDKSIRIWDIETGELNRTIRCNNGTAWDGSLYAAALSSDGKYLAVGGYTSRNEIRIIDLDRTKQIATLKGHNDVISYLAFSSDGKYLASCSFDKNVIIWQLTDNKPVSVLKGHTNYVYAAEFSPDGKQLVSASFDKTLRLWDLGNLQNPHFIEMKNHTAGVCCALYTPDGKNIISAGKDNRIIYWDMRGNYIKDLDKTEKEINTISVSDDGKMLIAHGVSGYTGTVYNLSDGKKISAFLKHTTDVTASAFSPLKTRNQMHLIATAGINNGKIFIWNAENGEVVTEITSKGQNYSKVGFAENLNIAVYFDNEEQRKFFDLLDLRPLQEYNPNIRFDQSGFSNKKLIKLDKRTLQIEKTIMIQNKETDGDIQCFTFTTEGKVVVGSEYSLKVYESNGNFVKELLGHTGQISFISSSKDGKIIISAGTDQILKLWNSETGENLANMFFSSDNEWVCWIPKGYYFASAGGEKYIGWQLNKGLDEISEYYPSYSFRKKYMNPEIVKQTISLGSFTKALGDFNNVHKNQLSLNDNISLNLPPKVEWIDPPVMKISTADKSYSVKFKVTSETKLKDVRIMVNAKAVVIDSSKFNGDPKKPNEYTFEVNLEENTGIVRGKPTLLSADTADYEVTLNVYAANENSSITSEERRIRYSTKEAKIEKARLFMVNIGISEFENPKNNLSYAAADAASFSEMYEKQKGKLFKEILKKDLLNKDATAANIKSAFSWLKENAKPKDMVILFIASHGFNEQGKFYLLPYDGKVENLSSTAVDAATFANTLAYIPCKVMLFLDACHSGELGTDLLKTKTAPDNTETLRDLSSNENGVVIFSASTGNELSREYEHLKHGVFTYSLIEAMQNSKADLIADGMIYLPELETYVSQIVKKLTGDRQHSTMQKPSSISVLPLFQLW